MVTIHVHSCSGVTTLTMPSGAPLASALREQGLLPLPCGAGRCGKCLIQARTVPAEEEIRLLGAARLAAGWRLACHTRAEDGLHVTIPDAKTAAVLTSFAAADYIPNPVVQRRAFTVPEPILHDESPEAGQNGQRDDLAAILQAAGATDHKLPLRRLAALPAFRRAHAETPGYALLRGTTLLGLSDNAAHTAFVVDIGTTTVAALLADLEHGVVLAALGERSAQAPFGADVITRIRHTMEHSGEGLRQAIVNQINHLCAGLQAQDASVLIITGNTTMLHLFCGLPAEHIGRAPFVPALLAPLWLNAREAGLHSDAPLVLMPGIAAYVGADITAALLAANAHIAHDTFLLLDLGTNAEIVLHAHGRFHACSAAAGPCFEGATLQCGMAGETGAIDHVFADPERGFAYTVLNGGEARGLCGSGILDAMALLLDTGAVDETGRLSATGPLAAHIRDYAGQPALYFCDTVVLTQKDIREVQLAKAAVRAGVEILLRQADTAAEDVAVLYLAGGFGSALSPRSAARLGLVPPVLAERIRPLGNAACCGALRYVADAEACAAAESIIRNTRHTELSAHPDFSTAYIEHITFSELS